MTLIYIILIIINDKVVIRIIRYKTNTRVIINNNMLKVQVNFNFKNIGITKFEITNVLVMKTIYIIKIYTSI